MISYRIQQILLPNSHQSKQNWVHSGIPKIPDHNQVSEQITRPVPRAHYSGFTQVIKEIVGLWHAQNLFYSKSSDYPVDGVDDGELDERSEDEEGAAKEPVVE